MGAFLLKILTPNKPRNDVWASLKDVSSSQ
jgi:hypothetical protein